MVSVEEIRKEFEGYAGGAGRWLLEFPGVQRFVQKEIPKRRRECEQKGHDEYWHTRSIYYNSPLEGVSGFCMRCFARLQRRLNDEERKEIDEFYRMLREE